MKYLHIIFLTTFFLHACEESWLDGTDPDLPFALADKNEITFPDILIGDRAQSSLLIFVENQSTDITLQANGPFKFAVKDGGESQASLTLTAADLNANVRTAIYIIFEPESTGDFSHMLVIPTDFESIEIALNGSGVAGAIDPAALSFDGGDYLQTAFTGVTGEDARTMEAWIKYEGTEGAPVTETMILSWGENSADLKWDMRVHSDGTLRIEYSGGAVFGTTPVDDGEWHHVAVIYPGGAPLSETILVIDGTEEAEYGQKTGSNNVNTSDVNFVTIGRGASHTDRFWVGQMSDVRIWGVARSVADINDNMNARLNGNEEGLVAYWKLDEGLGDAAADGSANGYSATFGDPENSDDNPTWIELSGIQF